MATSNFLLKEATRLKKSGQITEAISALEGAYEAVKAEGIQQSLSAYLRLPKYLLIAGQNDRAWSVLNSMIVNGISGTVPCKEMMFMEQSLIYECMASQLEKEGKHFESGLHHVVSYLSWIKALIAQDRYSDIPETHNFSYLDKVLKKESLESLAGSISPILTDALQNIKTIKISDTLRSLRSLRPIK